MKKVTLDSNAGLAVIRSFVAGAPDEEVELCDPQGAVIGYFIPAAVRLERAYQQATEYARANAEELERRCQGTDPGITTQELLARLKALAP